MVGKDILIPASEEGQEAIKSFPENKRMECKLKYVQKHNLERHDLFFACIKLVADSIGKLEWEVEEQVKINCRWIKGYVYYKDKNGKERVNIETKSIAFSKMTIQEADQFYSVAFDKLAEFIQLSAEEMTAEAKKRMKRRY
jgi:hypothetical protein